ncbi:MAG: hypothetical protein JW955_25830 [Sedimentisphaerales bacterium]|nr:hypothetical protein [Sedimentisphaerales bacterium]
MDAKVKLSDILDALEMQNDETNYYLDTNTGAVYLLTPDDLYAGEEDDPIEEYPEWQRQTIEVARRLAKGDDENLIELPTQWDVNEYEIMEEFCDTQSDAKVQDALFAAIKGKGAFRRFKDAVHRFGIIDDWHTFRLAKLKVIAVDWCRANEIEYVDDTAS